MLHTLLTILTPDNCLHCRAEGALLCKSCSRLAIPTEPSRCFFCFAITTDGNSCKNCYARTYIYKALTCGRYKDVLKQLVHAYKFEHNRSVADVLAGLLHNKLPVLPSNVLVTYIPTAHAHMRERGFDHAKMLAKAYAKKCNTVAVPLLYRQTQTAQRGATRAVRMQNMGDAFVAKVALLQKDTHVVIIDDVITTGATVRAAARVLTDAGASRVTVLAVAYA